MKVTITADFSSFKHGIIRAKAQVKAITVAGMQAAMEKYKNDALNKIPMVPYRSGWLRDHHIYTVLSIPHGVIGTLKTYNTPYAAAVHEGIRKGARPFQYRTPGTGPKWIGAKLLLHHVEYIRIATRGI